MKVFIVHAHPEPNSFNGALLDVAVKTFQEKGHEVRVSDLYQMNYNPVSDRKNFTTVKDAEYYKQQIEELHATECGGFAKDVESEIQNLEWCDLLIFQFPLWWFGLPAILKGWVDRTLAMGRTYTGKMLYDTGHFKGKKAFCSLTTGGPAETYDSAGIHGSLESILRPVNHGIFEFVGFEALESYVVFGPARLTEEQRKGELDRYREKILSF